MPLLRFFGQLGVGYAVFAERFHVFGVSGLEHLLNGSQFGLRFLAPPQLRKNLRAHVVHALAFRREAKGVIDVP